jgi:copper chaperone NosL
MPKNVNHRPPLGVCILFRYFVLLITIASTFLFNSHAVASVKTYIKPSAQDKCPVCGMFVAKFPDWTAEIIYRDGTYRVFDGPKDMFKYLANLKKYEPSRQREDIVSIYVSDYYSVHPIDAYRSFFVTGSNINGPMGNEFVSFEKETDATEFVKDHAGKRILHFHDITPKVLREFE